MAHSTWLPRRYFSLFIFTYAYVTATGFRSTFSLVLTHISRVNQSDDGDNLFPNCSTIGKDYHVSWTGTQAALLHTIFFLGNFLSQPVGGILATRFPPKRVMAAVVFGTSAVFLLQPLAMTTRYELTAFLRFVQGVFEGVFIPAGYGFLSAWAPVKERSLFVGIANSGAYFSPAIALVLSGAMTCYVQWDAVIYLYGTLGVLWTGFVLIFVYDTPHQDLKMGPEEREMYEKDGAKIKPSGVSIVSVIPWKGIFTSLPVYAVLVGSTCRNWMFSIMLTLQPEYFKDAFGMNTATIGMLSWVPHVLMGSLSVSSGFIFDHVINKQWLSRTNARKLATALGFGTEGVCVLALYFIESHQWKIAFSLLSFGVGISGFIVSGYQANQMELAPQFTPIITAFTRIGTIASILSTGLVGLLVGNTHAIEGWQRVFLISGMINLCGLTFYLIFSSAELQSWARPGEITVLVDESHHQKKKLKDALE